MEAGRTKRPRVFYYDLIRAFSCLCIMTVHFNASVSGWLNGQFLYPNSLVPNYYLHGQIYLGGIGVSLFFMLSGATLMMNYHGTCKQFYLKRFKSIYPMFWIAYAAVAMIDFMLSRSLGSTDYKLLPLTVAGLDGYLATLGLTPYGFYKIGEWFLGCIVVLYLVFPVVHACLERSPAVTAVGSVVLAAVLSLACERFLGYHCSGLEPWYKVPEMVLGMLFVKYSLDRKALLLTVVSGICVGIVWLLRLPVNALVLCTLLCCFLFSLLTYLAGFVRIAAARTLVSRFAKLSYPIFLTHHWIIGKMVQGFRLETMQRSEVLALFVTYVAVTLIASAMLEHTTNGILHAFTRTGSKTRNNQPDSASDEAGVAARYPES